MQKQNKKWLGLIVSLVYWPSAGRGFVWCLEKSILYWISGRKTWCDFALFHLMIVPESMQWVVKRASSMFQPSDAVGEVRLRLIIVFEYLAIGWLMQLLSTSHETKKTFVWADSSLNLSISTHQMENLLRCWIFQSCKLFIKRLVYFCPDIFATIHGKFRMIIHSRRAFGKFFIMKAISSFGAQNN